MSEPDRLAQCLFDEMAEEHLQLPEVTMGPILQNQGLKVNGKVFAFLKGDRLVVKIPAQQAATLVESGEGEAFESGGRTMREWVTVGAPVGGDKPKRWQVLTSDARRYVDPNRLPPSKKGKP
jgi:hypothetical protein